MINRYGKIIGVFYHIGAYEYGSLFNQRYLGSRAD